MDARDMGSILMLFTPPVNVPDLLLTDGALEGVTVSVRLILENHGAEKLRLKMGTILGTLSPVDDVTVGSSADSREGATSVCGAVDLLEWGRRCN